MNEQNPYAPPKAPVSDIDSSVKPPVPPHVETACQLMWIGLGLRLLSGIAKVFASPTTVYVMGILIGSLIGLGIGYVLLRWVTGRLRAGKNWMRWLITTFNVIGWASVPLLWTIYTQLFAADLKNPITAVLILAEWTIGIAAIVLLHTRPSRKWFRGGGAS